MKLLECVENCIEKVRKPEWPLNAYLQLDLVNGSLGGWAKLYDQPTQDVIGVESPQSILIVGDQSDDWEEFFSNKQMKEGEK